jgi:hypothetical protein
LVFDPENRVLSLFLLLSETAELLPLGRVFYQLSVTKSDRRRAKLLQ